MNDDPTTACCLRGEGITFAPNGRENDQQKRQRHGKQPKRQRPVARPDEQKCTHNQQREQRLHLPGSDWHPAVGFSQHFGKRHKMKHKPGDRGEKK